MKEKYKVAVLAVPVGKEHAGPLTQGKFTGEGQESARTTDSWINHNYWWPGNRLLNRLRLYQEKSCPGRLMTNSERLRWR